MKNIHIITTKIIGFIGLSLMILPIGILTYSFLFPDGITSAKDFNTDKENEILLKPIFDDKTPARFKDPFLGLDNSNLNGLPLQFNATQAVTTTGANIKIPSIGVNTTIYESLDTEAALEQGVWRDFKHGTPDRYDQPIVLAAHRWGQERLSWEHRTQHLFYKLDELQAGQIVEITWNNQIYKFQIRKVEQNFVVNDIADLIMYTCVYYGSPERYIVYADRI